MLLSVSGFPQSIEIIKALVHGVKGRVSRMGLEQGQQEMEYLLHSRQVFPDPLNSTYCVPVIFFFDYTYYLSLALLYSQSAANLKTFFISTNYNIQISNAAMET